VRVQLRFMTAYPDSLIPFFTAPLFTIVFLLVFKHAGRQDLTAYAAIAPVFIALWWLALFNSGWTITIERWNGTLEMLVAAPSSFGAVIFGRIATTTAIGTVSFFEAWLVARLIFGATVTIHHWGAFLLTVVATLAAIAGSCRRREPPARRLVLDPQRGERLLVDLHAQELGLRLGDPGRLPGHLLRSDREAAAIGGADGLPPRR